ncbi:hypothetical protein CV770_26775 [Bradyrhizobium sp. AC87j1]|uniref:DUF2806 domain-containing protein n=1 Tax=Bradyrhizobium sp. AC87j1 TaxID=2055894 RepID=UPI000CEBCA32|nr:DUF2806 domain-containing protein [Bradyrhizobium sp. AC87j1]PPQ16351.1 hypothetical protein CV770_26775 [Bradyrhizobium sp. AC87j1]
MEDLPDASNSGNLPSFGDWLANLLGFHLPAIPMPQTRKNFDKAASKVFLAAGENVEARLKANTGRVKAAGRLAVEGMYRTEDEKRKLQNRADVVAIAVEELNRTSENQPHDATDEIEDDWLNLFARVAEDKTSDELKSLFGRILAGEIRKPGSFSLRTVQFLSTLSKSDAHEISAFLSFVIDDRLVPSDGTVKAAFVQRVLMEELGIASQASTIGGLAWKFFFRPKTTTLLTAAGSGVIVINESAKPIQLALNCQILTKTGQELLTIANPQPTDAAYINSVAQTLFDKIGEAGYADEIELGTISVFAGPLRGAEGITPDFKAAKSSKL